MAYVKWPQIEHRQWLTLACTSWETPEPVHPVNYRPHQNTNTQPPPQVARSRSRLSGHQSYAEVGLLCGVGPIIADPAQREEFSGQ